MRVCRQIESPRVIRNPKGAPSRSKSLTSKNPTAATRSPSVHPTPVRCPPPRLLRVTPWAGPRQNSPQLLVAVASAQTQPCIAISTRRLTRVFPLSCPVTPRTSWIHPRTSLNHHDTLPLPCAPSLEPDPERVRILLAPAHCRDFFLLLDPSDFR